MNEVYGPGLVAGRFQPLHYGHQEYIMAAFRLCTHLYIGITNPDPGKYFTTYSDKHRSLAVANPYSYEIREKMIHELMTDNRIHESEYTVIPIRLESPDDCRKRVPADTTVLMTIYDSWGQEKKKLFEEMGFKVQVLWERRETIVRGMDIRAKIRESQEWQHLVPPSTYRVIHDAPETHAWVNSELTMQESIL
jgi:cytidyltransferase-like protein